MSVINRNQFVSCLIEELWMMLPQFQAEGLAPFMQQWRDADLYYHKPVTLVSGNYVSSGISKGIDSSGALLLETDGQVKSYHGGEISVRPA
jgi:BirA family biotin operon repressor/biotin-[acetyl-CoA-carboxylase] ligase